MAAVEDLCPGCFTDKGRQPACPTCHYDESLERSPLLLAHRTMLQGDDLCLGCALGELGGFSITYLAWDTSLELRVAIKEFLPRDLASRGADGTTVHPYTDRDRKLFSDGLEDFVAEARTLARLDHPNIVRVRRFFEQNATAYMVMDYYDGLDLREYLETQGGRIPEQLAVDVMMPVLDGLRYVHDHGYLHRDVKPANIYLKRRKIPVLLDFGSARIALGERSRSLSVVLTEGYAPFEQYHRKGRQGPWTDVYASAATLYNLVTGKKPPAATERMAGDDLVPPERLVSGLSTPFCAAVRSALAVPPEDRPRSIEHFQQILLGSEKPARVEPRAIRETAPIEETPPKRAEKPAPPKKRRGGRWLAAALVLVVVAAGLFLSREQLRYRAHVYRGVASLTDRDYAEARLAFEQARGVRDSEEVRERLAQVRAEMDKEEEYNDLLAQGDQELEEGSWSQARDTLTAALAVFDREPARARLEQVQATLEEEHARLLTQGERQLAQNSWIEAEDSFTAALALLDREPARARLEQLQAKMEEEQARLLARGDQQLTQGSWIPAHETYQAARAIFGGQETEDRLERLRNRIAISASGDESLRLWDLETGREIMRLTGHTKGVLGVAVSPDGRRALSGSYDHTIRLWDLETGREIRRLSGHSDWVRSVVFSPDGQRALSGSDDKTVRLWDLGTGREIRRLSGHSDYVRSVAFSPDGQRALSGSDDKTLRLWDPETGSEIRRLSGHSGWVRSVVFSPDGQRALSGSDDKTMRLWDLETGREIRRLLGHSDYVLSVVFSPDGQRALSGSDDKTMRLWDLETGREVRHLEGQSAPVLGVSFCSIRSPGS